MKKGTKMKAIIILLYSSIIALFLQGCVNTTNNNLTRVENVNQVIKIVESKLSNIMSYTAEVERKRLDPNGGFNSSVEKQTVCRPNKMVVKSILIEAHNQTYVGKILTAAVNNNHLYTQIGDGKIYKNSFESYEKNGGPSLRMYMAYLGNLTDPFFIYEMKTLKLQSETEKEWILTAKYKILPKMPHWLPQWTNQITIDKQTGLIKKIVALDLDGKSVTLLNVKNIFPSSLKISETKFNIENKTKK